jgi:hypothetical protein
MIKNKNMKNYKVLLPLSLLLLIMAAACKPDTIGPLSDDGTIPAPVKNAQVKNISGGAEISYTLPDNANLLYVKAVFDLKGVKTEVKSSFYKNSLLAEGFGDTNEHEVLLYAVSRSEKLSDPVKLVVKPLTPPVQNVRNSFVLGETFGGIYVRFKNADKSNIVIKVLVEDLTSKEWVNIDNYYTSLDSGQFAVRGLTPVLRKFGVFVKDRWDNVSDTLITMMTPVYEEQLDKTKFADMRKKNYPIPQYAPLPGSGQPIIEAVDYSGSYPLKNLWDGSTTTMFHTKEKYDQPIWVPIDLGAKATLSRFKIWQRTSSTYNYNHGNPHKWEIWGTNTINDINSWVKLGDFTMIKPSNLPPGQNSNEDNEAVAAGHEFEFPIGIPAVRYIAWKNIDSWGSLEGETGFLHMMEMTVWGQKQ